MLNWIESKIDENILNSKYPFNSDYDYQTLPESREKAQWFVLCGTWLD